METSREDIPLPGFDRMSIAYFMKGNVGFFHLSGDPGPGLARPWFLTGGDDRPEILIEGDPETPLSQNLFHTEGNPDFRGEKNEAGIGRPPDNLFLISVPGKDALTVGFQDPLRGKISTDGKDPALRGQMRRRKQNLLYKLKYGHANSPSIRHGTVSTAPLFHGGLILGKYTLPAEDLESGMPPVGEHGDQVFGNPPFDQEHLENLVGEDRF